MRIVLFIVLLASQILLFGQDQYELTSNIKLISKYDGSKVILRWAPNHQSAWKLGNKYGYVIERAELPEDTTKGLTNFTKLSLTPKNAWSEIEWQAKIDKENPDQFMMIAAQAVYGKDFNAISNASNLKGIQDAYVEETNRFGFALLAADYNAEAAEALGLRWLDDKVEANRTYVYRVYSLVPQTLITTDTAYVLVNTSKVEDLKDLPPLDVVNRENSVEIRWKGTLYDQFYTGYYLERASFKSNKFERLNESPYIVTRPEGDLEEDYLFSHTDSFSKNYKKYNYRLIGVTPFAEYIVSIENFVGFGVDLTPPNPVGKVEANSISKSEIEIKWEPGESSKDLEGYMVFRSWDEAGPYIQLMDDPTSKKIRNYKDKPGDMNGTIFYKVASVDTAGNLSVTFPVMAVVIDSIPPTMPQNLNGKIDKNGIVSLDWNLGPEQDILGYRVYFANQADHEFSNITAYPWQDTSYKDTISLNSLTENVYYKIVAVDQRYNHSEYSQILKLQRPDTIPPVKPLIDRYIVTDSTVYIEWIPSTSEDVVSHVLYRRKKGGSWIQIKEIQTDLEKESFVDSDVNKSEEWEYSFQAKDDDDLVSVMSNVLHVKIIDTKVRPDVQDLKAAGVNNNNQVQLSWNYTKSADCHFIIYRSYNGSTFRVYKSVDGSELSFTDTDLIGGGTYTYAVKAVYEDGGQSMLSKKVNLVIN